MSVTNYLLCVNIITNTSLLHVSAPTRATLRWNNTFLYSWRERNEASLFHALVLTVRMLNIICSLNRIC